MERKIFRLSDLVIGQIRELVQLAILTRTSVVDHFRMIRLEAMLNEETGEETGDLVLTKEYILHYNQSIEKMVKDLETMISQNVPVEEPKEEEKTSSVPTDPKKVN